MWLESEASVHVGSVLDLVGFGVSEFFLSLVSGFGVFTGSLDWDLSGSDLSLGSGLDIIGGFVVGDLDISCILLSSVFDVSVFNSVVITLN
jgi:hypothetical protein